MLSLRELQSHFASSLFDGVDEPAASSVYDDGLDGAARLRIYRNNLHEGFTKTLSLEFPVVERLVGEESREIHPYFHADKRCSECELLELADASGRRHRFRVFYPPGYWENTLRRYPVLVMQDGQNLFFPQEAFGGRHWRVAETLRLLDAMNAIEQAIIVGVYPNARETDYTADGYHAYGEFLAGSLKPFIDRQYRTLTGPAQTAVMGASLGGVVSLHLAWQYPQVFGAAACLSSTFGWRDDLAQRIEREPPRAIRIYLDSGWPNDNYEATRRMHTRLIARGYEPGRNLHCYSFPEAMHDETHWAMRAHLPFQLLLGKAA